MNEDTKKQSNPAKKNKVELKAARVEVLNYLETYRNWTEDDLEYADQDILDSFDELVKYVARGIFIINDDGTVIHKLKFPIGEDVNPDTAKKTLTYGTRLKGNAFDATRKIKNADDTAKIKAAIASLSDNTYSLICKMEFSDITTASSLINFFLVG